LIAASDPKLNCDFNGSIFCRCEFAANYDLVISAVADGSPVLAGAACRIPISNNTLKEQPGSKPGRMPACNLENSRPFRKTGYALQLTSAVPVLMEGSRIRQLLRVPR
jgi:hypothetical protein